MANQSQQANRTGRYGGNGSNGGNGSGERPPIGVQMKRRNVMSTWLLLPVITLGVYVLVWYYFIHDELRRFDPRLRINPVGSLLVLIFSGILFGIPALVSIYNTGKRIADAQRAAGLAPTCSGLLGVVLTFVFGLSLLYYQFELNKVVDQYGNAAFGGPVQLAA